MKFKIRLLRKRGYRLAWRDVLNGPHYTGDLITHWIDVAGERYSVATLRPEDPVADALIPDLFEPVLTGFSMLAFRLRGYERVESGHGRLGVVQEWHCEAP